MKVKFVCVVLCLPLLGIHQAFTQTRVTKDDYLKAIKENDEKIWQSYEAAYESWQKSDSLTRSPKPPEPQLAWGGKLDAFLYSVTGERKYAERARKALLLSGGDYTGQAIRQIEKSGVLSATDLSILKKKMVDAAEQAVKYWVEWGAMNHSTNHVVNLLTAVMDYLPDHPDLPRWKQKRDINLSSSWGLWSIEDSQNYIPIWFKPMMEYAEMAGREKEFCAMPMTKFYLDYFVQLVPPYGGIAEFGDSDIEGYSYFISCLEKGATVYRDGRMKWAAHRLFESGIAKYGLELGGLSWAAADWVDAYRWADDSVIEEVPTDGSRLVLEDYVGKKVVFRSGWDPNATYLFLNFLEDAPFGVDGKEHIINTINVETEKNHHGHADENGICLLMKDGSVLLHESGYRETASTGPDGEYRADTYHNKLVVRSGLADPQMRLLPFLLDGCRYKFVETKLMHFRTFKEVDISRTRLTYEEQGYQWDRLINYLKGREWFVVFDIVKILRDGPYTLANLFYTQDIVDYDQKDRSWFDTRYTTLGYYKAPNPANARLLIWFPGGTSFRRGAEQIRRCYQTEWAVYAAKAESLKAGDIFVFTTFLIPHPKNVEPKEIISSLSNMAIYHTERGYGVRIPTAEGYVQLNAMLDLEAEYMRENVRPRYNFESGKAEYGGLVTDARYCYLNWKKDEVFYSFFKASKLLLDGKKLFEAQGQTFAQDDGSFMKQGVAKWVAWEDRVSLKAK